jgi:putative nucleotidyltransferase with HDIG domain
MLITAVRSRAVLLPLQPVPYSVERAGTKREWGKTRLTPHRPKPSLQYVIVEIDTDDGITGVGEACTDIGFFGEPVEEVQSAIDLYLGPKLLGKDPFDREQLLFDIDFPGNSCAKSGIDLALHDLLGKALGVPVCNLIGGSGRRQVLAVMEVAPGTADGMARQCAEWVQQGVRGFKAKVGAIPEDDVERLAAIRAAVGPEIMLRADANQGYTPKEAIRLCRMCERRDLGLELLEQPVPKWDLAGMAQVRAAVDVLIEADEAAYTPHDVVQIIRHQAADVINIKIAKAGGLLHDIGKALTHEVEGPHAEIGAEVATKNKVPKAVVAAIAEHHDDDHSSPESFLVAAADAISAARPGARRDTVEHYLKRLQALEQVGMAFEGVEKCYAIQAGREVRIMVKPQSVDDVAATKMARDVVKKIEETLAYPGQIKVTVIRESRSVEYAR